MCGQSRRHCGRSLKLSREWHIRMYFLPARYLDHSLGYANNAEALPSRYWANPTSQNCVIFSTTPIGFTTTRMPPGKPNLLTMPSYLIFLIELYLSRNARVLSWL